MDLQSSPSPAAFMQVRTQDQDSPQQQAGKIPGAIPGKRGRHWDRMTGSVSLFLPGPRGRRSGHSPSQCTEAGLHDLSPIALSVRQSFPGIQADTQSPGSLIPASCVPAGHLANTCLDHKVKWLKWGSHDKPRAPAPHPRPLTEDHFLDQTRPSPRTATVLKRGVAMQETFMPYLEKEKGYPCKSS